MTSNDKAILDNFARLVPLMNDMMPIDIGVGLFDTEKCIIYTPGKLMDLGAKAGDPIKVGSGVHRAINEKRRIFLRIDKSVYGRPYLVVAVPIFNDSKEVIGGIAITEPLDKFDEAREIANKLFESTSILASTTEEISAQTEEISSVCQNLSSSVEHTNDQIKEMDQVLGLIKNIAGQTNLLGLNAAIESARVGEVGRGFGVVADEIRKLATNSSNSIKKISDVINKIQADSEEVFQQINYIDNVMAQIAEATANVVGAVQQVAAMAENLNHLAESLESDE
ncbi:MAG: hypothetical protein PWQ67_1812 [Clostridia bacterium]|nr:hypothetical protein [Clostridia bacterium]MDN5323358.1 hypothetical protein [Clostridia bacterium]